MCLWRRIASEEDPPVPTNNASAYDGRWDGPPPKRATWVPIYRAPVRGVVSAVATTPKVWGCMTHFLELRTVPCHGHDCDGCRQQLPRWRGFIGAYSESTMRPCLLEVTPSAVETCGVDLWDAVYSLRGRVVTISRRTPRRQSPVLLRIGDVSRAAEHLYAEVDVAAALRRVWSIPGQPAAIGPNVRITEGCPDPDRGK